MKLDKASKRDKKNRKARHGQKGNPKFTYLMVDCIEKRDSETLAKRNKRGKKKGRK